MAVNETYTICEDSMLANYVDCVNACTCPPAIEVNELPPASLIPLEYEFWLCDDVIYYRENTDGVAEWAVLSENVIPCFSEVWDAKL